MIPFLEMDPEHRGRDPPQTREGMPFLLRRMSGRNKGELLDISCRCPEARSDSYLCQLTEPWGAQTSSQIFWMRVSGKVLLDEINI